MITKQKTITELAGIFNLGSVIADVDIVRYHNHLDQTAKLLQELDPMYRICGLKLRADADKLQEYITARGLHDD